MRITYFALRPLLVGDETRQPGDLVPEAAEWPYVSGYVSDGKIAPVLVATLPEDVQMTLLEWEAEQIAASTPAAATDSSNDEEKVSA